MSEERQISVERAEKISSLIRNVIIIIGGIAAAFTAINTSRDSQISAYVRTFYINGDRIRIVKPEEVRGLDESKLEQSSPIFGNLGTLSRIVVTNNSTKSGKLDVIMIKFEGLSDISGSVEPEKVFQVVYHDTNCLIGDDQILAPKDGLVKEGLAGKISINQFPPKCSLTVDIASSQASRSARLKSGDVAVYFNGNPVKVRSGAYFYNNISKKVAEIFEGGFLSIIAFIILPFCIIQILLILTMSAMLRAGSKATDVPEPEGAQTR